MEVGGEHVENCREMDDVVVLVGQQVAGSLFQLFVVNWQVHFVLEQPEEQL